HPPAGVAGVFARQIGAITRRSRAVEVIERLSDTGSDTRPLNKGTVEAEDRWSECVADVGRGNTHGDVSARRTPCGLLAGVGCDVGAGAHHELVRGAVVDITCGRSAGEVAVTMVGRFRPRIAADLQTDVGARHIIEPR